MKDVLGYKTPTQVPKSKARLSFLHKIYVIMGTQRYHGDIYSDHAETRIGAFVTSDSNWSKDKATDEIRAIARHKKLEIAYKRHAVDRLSERGLIISDVLYVLKYGFVHLEPEPATRPGYNRYAMECKCPNGGGRSVRVVVIPDKKPCLLKIVTVMWVDEAATRAGTIVGE